MLQNVVCPIDEWEIPTILKWVKQLLNESVGQIDNQMEIKGNNKILQTGVCIKRRYIFILSSDHNAKSNESDIIQALK